MTANADGMLHYAAFIYVISTENHYDAMFGCIVVKQRQYLSPSVTAIALCCCGFIWKCRYCHLRLLFLQALLNSAAAARKICNQHENTAYTAEILRLRKEVALLRDKSNAAAASLMLTHDAAAEPRSRRGSAAGRQQAAAAVPTVDIELEDFDS